MDDGRTVEVWSVGKMRLNEFRRLAFDARASAVMSGCKHQKVITMTVRAQGATYEITGTGSNVESALEAALERLAIVQRDAGTAALA